MAGNATLQEKLLARRMDSLVGAVAYLQWQCGRIRLPVHLRPEFAIATVQNDFTNGANALAESCEKFLLSYNRPELRKFTRLNRESEFIEAVSVHAVDIARPLFIFDRPATHIALGAATLALRDEGWRPRSLEHDAQWELEGYAAFADITENSPTAYPAIAASIREHWQHHPERYGGAYSIVHDWLERLHAYEWSQ